MRESDVPSPAREVQRFQAWYEADFDYVWRCLRRLGVPSAEAADLTHDVFVVAWRQRSNLDPERPRRPWLFGVAFRVAAAHRRKAWFRRTEPEADHDLADTGLSPEQAAVVRSELRLLEQALNDVSLKQRAVLLLHDFDEVPVAEVALALNLPPKTVYSRLAAARQRFRQAYRQLQLTGVPVRLPSKISAGECP